VSCGGGGGGGGGGGRGGGGGGEGGVSCRSLQEVDRKGRRKGEREGGKEGRTRFMTISIAKRNLSFLDASREDDAVRARGAVHA